MESHLQHTHTHTHTHTLALCGVQASCHTQILQQIQEAAAADRELGWIHVTEAGNGFQTLSKQTILPARGSVRQPEGDRRRMEGRAELLHHQLQLHS